MNYRKLVFLSICVLAITSCKKQEKNRSFEEEMKLLYEQEKKNEDRAKYGGDTKEIKIISNAKEVEKEKLRISKNIQQKQEEEQKIFEKDFAGRYKKGDKTVIPQLIEILQKGDAKAKRSLYYELGTTYDTPEYKMVEPELIKIILDNIDTLEDEKSVIQLAGIMKLPGYVKKFEEHLFSGKSKDIQRLIYWLGQEGSSFKTLGYLKNKILSRKFDLNEEDWLMSGVEGFVENGNENVKKTAIDLCFDIYRQKLISQENFNKMKDSWSSSNPAIDLTTILLESGDNRAVPFARELLEKGISEEQAFGTLIQLEGEKHKPLFYTYLKDPEKFSIVLQNAVLMYEATKDEDIVMDIISHFEAKEDFKKFEIDEIARILYEIGGSSYLDVLDKTMKNKNLAQRIKKAHFLTTVTMQDMAEDLYKMGIVDHAFEKKTFDKAKKYAESEDYMEDPGYTYSFLMNSGIFLWFDTETGFIPVDYDVLITNFFKNARGKFKDAMVWMDVSEKPFVNDALDYKITLIANDKIYIATPEDIGDWYDMEVVLQLLNKVLDDAGNKERFVFIDTGDQTAQFMFGPEKKVKQFAEKYNL
ncbi:hypothetical protein [Aquimarina algiphila]|uniref:hypothetical protein n=1 Tax=Aquimarina algiphila TaxID=2047982 RepID=UPI00232FB11F|nr:hypothetical protein [Aquimarina algiphila]